MKILDNKRKIMGSLREKKRHEERFTQAEKSVFLRGGGST